MKIIIVAASTNCTCVIVV